MHNLLEETNSKLSEIIKELDATRSDYQSKIQSINEEIAKELEVVKKYKEDFFTAKAQIEKTNSDIESFEKDYQSLLDKFKGDDIGNILLNTTKEINAKIEEKKKKILADKKGINTLIAKAEIAKNKLVKLTAEKKILEVRLTDVEDIYNYYNDEITKILEYTKKNEDNIIVTNKRKEEALKEEAKKQEELKKQEEAKAEKTNNKEEDNDKDSGSKRPKKDKKKDNSNKDGENKENDKVSKEEEEITFDFNDLEKIISFDDALDK